MQTQLAARIVDLRERVNMSQSELAKRLGIDKSSMNKIEKSTRKVSSEELDKIASIFDVSTDYLLGRSTPDRKHIEQDLDKAIDESRSFDGKPISDHDREVVKKILRGYFN
jgi:transcriptional regulator with XRE-family HTH domain